MNPALVAVTIIFQASDCTLTWSHWLKWPTSSFASRLLCHLKQNGLQEVAVAWLHGLTGVAKNLNQPRNAHIPNELGQHGVQAKYSKCATASEAFEAYVISGGVVRSHSNYFILGTLCSTWVVVDSL